MANALDHPKLEYARALITSQPGLKGLLAFYDFMEHQGYNYAYRAEAVVTQNSFGGAEAFAFLESWALKNASVNLYSNTQLVNDIEIDLANRWVNALEAIAGTTGTVSADLDFTTTQAFHAIVFGNNHIPAEAWTLTIPGEIMGSQLSEQIWQEFLNNAAPGFANALATTYTMAKVEAYVSEYAVVPASSFDPTLKSQAWQWLVTTGINGGAYIVNKAAAPYMDAVMIAVQAAEQAGASAQQQIQQSATNYLDGILSNLLNNITNNFVRHILGYDISLGKDFDIQKLANQMAEAQIPLASTQLASSGGLIDVGDPSAVAASNAAARQQLYSQYYSILQGYAGQDNNSYVDLVTADSAGNQTRTREGWNATDDISYEEILKTPVNNGQITATINGKGDVVKMDNTNITLADNTTITMSDGKDNIIYAGKNDIIISDPDVHKDATFGYSDLNSDQIYFKGHPLYIAWNGMKDEYNRTYSYSGNTVTVTSGDDTLTLKNYHQADFTTTINSFTFSLAAASPNQTFTYHNTYPDGTPLNVQVAVTGQSENGQVQCGYNATASYLNLNGNVTRITSVNANDTTLFKPYGVNNNGEMYGIANNQWVTCDRGGGFTIIPFPPNAPFASQTVSGINNNGTVIASYVDSGGAHHTFKYGGSVPVELQDSGFTAIDDAEDVIGVVNVNGNLSVFLQTATNNIVDTYIVGKQVANAGGAGSVHFAYRGLQSAYVNMSAAQQQANQNNANVNIPDNSTYNSTGNGNTFTTGANDTVNVSGNNNTVTTGLNNTVTVSGTGNRVNATADAVQVSANSQATVNGNSNNVTSDTNSTLYVNGTSNQVKAAADLIQVVASAQVTVSGNGNTVTLGINDTLSISGSNNVVNATSGDVINISPNAKVRINGSGYSFTAAYGDDVTINYAAGNSQEQLYAPSAAVSLIRRNFTGLNLGGTHTYDVYNWVAGGSQLQWQKPDANISIRYQNFAGADGTGTHTYDLVNWNAGGSQYQWFNPDNNISLRYQNYSGANGTGTHTYDLVNWNASGSQYQWFNPSSAISTRYQNYSGANGSGTHISDVVNWTAGGSQWQIFSGLAAGISQEIINYSGANAMGTITSHLLYGASGNDTLHPNAPNEILVGNGGYDTYQFNKGNGKMVIQNGVASNNAANGELDFGAGIATNQLWFSRSGNDLLIQEMGTTESVNVSGWYSNGYSDLKEIKIASGSMIDAQLANLVHTMAIFSGSHSSFNPITAISMPTDTSLQNTLAAAWHH